MYTRALCGPGVFPFRRDRHPAAAWPLPQNLRKRTPVAPPGTDLCLEMTLELWFWYLLNRIWNDPVFSCRFLFDKNYLTLYSMVI